MSGHPLALLLRDAANGHSPPADGQVHVLPPLSGRIHAVVGFVAHHVVAAPVSVGEVDQVLVPGDLGAPLKAPFITWLAERLGAEAGSVDVVLVAPERPPEPPLALIRRDDLAGHPRVSRARSFRSDLQVFADSEARGVVMLGRGLADRLEVAFEVDAGHRGRGIARGLAAAAVLRAEGEPLFAQVAAANVAALRVLLATGFRPIGAEVLLIEAGG